MARKKKPETPDVSDVLANTHIADAGDIIEQRIVDTASCCIRCIK